MRKIACLVALMALSSPLSAQESLGVYVDWAAFRDADGTRCYAISKPVGDGSNGAYASVANWPKRGIRGQFHIRLPAAPRAASVRLRIGGRNFSLVTRGRDAWAKDRQMDAAIVAALRSAQRMTVSGRDKNGRRFTAQYDLVGIATAIDASIVGCTSA
ncbi:invasion associated locus B family protein [Erythrobacter sp. MTPC3]|uniref:invasion associated locus B family protein n=1 Tax=Erythrobacter sp. MTPC3 TaxID=3056564 RepID=UPI0036F437CA